MNSIVDNLELICDKENLQDRKLLLLAHLMQSKCDTLNTNQQELKSSLKDTNEKLDRLLNVMTAYEEVIDNKESFEHLLMIVKYPKAFILLLVGCLSLVGGAFGNKIWDFIKMLLSAL